jgi:hypothetical protein
MDTCKICGITLTGQYYRVATEMACPPCADQTFRETTENNGQLVLRGILFAFLAACAGALLRWGFEALFIGQGNYDFLTTIAMFLRFFIFLTIAFMIATAAKAGSRGRGGIVLQICATAFTYLAINLAFVPLILTKVPQLGYGPKGLLTAALAALALPFIALAKNLFNVTGLIATFFCMVMVWRGTERNVKQVDGPFSVGVPGGEMQLFKGLG